MNFLNKQDWLVLLYYFVSIIHQDILMLSLRVRELRHREILKDKYQDTEYLECISSFFTNKLYMEQYHLLKFRLHLKIHLLNGIWLKVAGLPLCTGVQDLTTSWSWTSLSKLIQLCTVGTEKQLICFHNPCILVTYGFSWEKRYFSFSKI